MEWFLARTRKPEPSERHEPGTAGGEPAASEDDAMHGQSAPAEAALPPGGERTARVLSMRALVTYQLARWPECEAGEPEQSVERLAHQGRQLLVPVETLIVELRQLVDRHVTSGDVVRGRALRDALVSRLIAAYYR